VPLLSASQIALTVSPDLRLTVRDSFTLRNVALLVLVMALLFWHDCASVKYGNPTFFKFWVAVIWHHALIRRGDTPRRYGKSPRLRSQCDPGPAPRFARHWPSAGIWGSVRSPHCGTAMGKVIRRTRATH